MTKDPDPNPAPDLPDPNPAPDRGSLHRHAVASGARECTKLLRLPEVVELTGISEATLRFWRHQSTPERPVGPRSAKLGKRIVYREADVLAWVDAQFEDSAS